MIMKPLTAKVVFGRFFDADRRGLPITILFLQDRRET